LTQLKAFGLTLLLIVLAEFLGNGWSLFEIVVVMQLIALYLQRRKA